MCRSAVEFSCIINVALTSVVCCGLKCNFLMAQPVRVVGPESYMFFRAGIAATWFVCGDSVTVMHVLVILVWTAECFRVHGAYLYCRLVCKLRCLV